MKKFLNEDFREILAHLGGFLLLERRYFPRAWARAGVLGCWERFFGMWASPDLAGLSERVLVLPLLEPL